MTAVVARNRIVFVGANLGDLLRTEFKRAGQAALFACAYFFEFAIR